MAKNGSNPYGAEAGSIPAPPTWQEKLPGFGPGAESLAEQTTMFDVRPERKPAAHRDLPGQTTMF